MLAFIVVAATSAVMAVALLVAVFPDRRWLGSSRRTRSASADAVEGGGVMDQSETRDGY